MSKEVIFSIITEKLKLPSRAVKNTINLIEKGATIPFISRYRKEATGSLNEVDIGEIDKAWREYNELIKRKQYITETIRVQGHLTTTLQKKINDCWENTVLEDLYLPFKKKRKTRAVTAKENGLEPLAQVIWGQNKKNLEDYSKQFINKKVPDNFTALQGARDIIAEWINEESKARHDIRRIFERSAMITSKVIIKNKKEAEKYKDYFDYAEPAKKAPAHRLLAILRGEKEGFLKVSLLIDLGDVLYKLETGFISRNSTYECENQLKLAIEDSYKRLLGPSIETEFRNKYKDKADDDAIAVFAQNLKQLLLAPPLGSKAILGIDPGFRSGCKVVCLDQNGNLINNTAIYPHPPQNQYSEAQTKIKELVDRYGIEAIAIGNGTAGKESFAMIKDIRLEGDIEVFMVNESGASIYSASEIARKEFPDHDITVRGAVSIGRRLMDPLSELVKIDPKSIGVGQYQHDVNQPKLKENLVRCVESAVNAVGVNLNTASKHVLTYISGLGPTLAKNIVEYRSENGSFKTIESLKKVPRMGAKAFEQSAGFLRIRNGKNILDNTGVHPERYPLVRSMTQSLKSDVKTFLSDPSLREKIILKDFESDQVGMPTLKDIIEEMGKTGLDIRGSAKAFEFTDGVNSISDVKEGMMINGIINNVTKFGAFVDIGIKESGLIHVSQMADTFVKDPLQVVKLNQEVVARVIEVDVGRKRISLSLKK
ncbi:MAG: Tex family protein [Saprospiraceae bacterium]